MFLVGMCFDRFAICFFRLLLDISHVALYVGVCVFVLFHAVAVWCAAFFSIAAVAVV